MSLASKAEEQYPTTEIEITVVVPVYNEASNLSVFSERILTALEEACGPKFEVIFCLDPSSDNSEIIIKQLCASNSRIKLIKFSRRFGQPSATMAGLKSSVGKFVLIIDAYLQVPPELISRLYAKIVKDNLDVVFARRKKRRGENPLRRLVSYCAYLTMSRLSEVDIPRNTGDFRIMSRRVVNELTRLKEKNSFLRGLVAYVGFHQGFVDYERDPRLSGRTKYNRLFGSLLIGGNGIFSFSSKPLSMVAWLGFLISGLSFLVGLIYLGDFIRGKSFTPGLPTTVLLLTFLSGIQLFSLGLVGQYITRIYDEVKNRPRYIVSETVNINNAHSDLN